MENLKSASLGLGKLLEDLILICNLLLMSSFRGASGYGSFDVDHFTHKSMVVVHPQAVAPKV